MHPIYALLALAGQLSSPAGQHARPNPVPVTRPNIVLIVADDFGVDLVSAYGEGSAPPCMPSLSALTTQGLVFRNAWTNPLCSPTRAAILTGRHGFRTGIGNVVTPTEAGLDLTERTLPEMLLGYDSVYVGKWHLAGNLGDLHPNDSGFGRFAGSLRGALANYFQWQKVVDGQASISTTYATIDAADEAIAALQTMQRPWLLIVAFNAPHDPYHVPPAALCPPTVCTNVWCGNLGTNPTAQERGKAMAEAMDTELGRVVAALDIVDPSAFVFFIGDNGTAAQLSEAPFLPAHAKGTLYEGGVNVPLIARGPGIAPGECAALVSSVDLFATCAELARVAGATEDSVSLVPYFSNSALALRETVYTERFTPNGGVLPFSDHRRAVRDGRYKLIRATGQADELYDLATDPFETLNLLPGLTASEQAAYNALIAELVALGVG